MKIKIRNQISVEEFCRLRELVNFQKLSLEQGEKVLENTSYTAVAMDHDIVVGTTRLLFDYGTDAYITDVIVDPSYHGCGIGKLLIENVLDYIRDSVNGTQVVCSLYANQGKEEFYEHYGFEKLPNSRYGYGMTLDVF